MNALKLLKQDHDEVKSMLSDLESTTDRAEKTRTEGLATLKAELEIHETIEEEIFYPALKEHPKTKDLALEGYEEHHVVDMVMAEIEGVEPSDETWMAKFSVMKENLEHHIEEEEGEMFDQAEKVFDDDELEELGDRMQARKEALKATSSA
ncbi:MAG TPA: hemerythrin domain-containing protein [Actinomycetota bacterium]|nr:hemerythrin domain-containing protein [Actinomycetota bacterium]